MNNQKNQEVFILLIKDITFQVDARAESFQKKFRENVTPATLTTMSYWNKQTKIQVQLFLNFFSQIKTVIHYFDEFFLKMDSQPLIQDFELKVKIVVVGDGSVGKTSLLQRSVLPTLKIPKNMIRSKHSVENSGFFCPSDFTWNQFWVVVKF